MNTNSYKSILLSLSKKALPICWLIVVTTVVFHGFISTWGGTIIGPLEIWKGWKDLAICGLVLVSFLLIIFDSSLRDIIWSRIINKLIVGYTILMTVTTLLSGQINRVSLLGLAINLRFLAMFIITQVVIYYFATTSHKELDNKNSNLLNWRKLLLIPCAAVVVFGLLQLFVLPKDFLTHFGYDETTTIAPFLTIDSQPNTLRISSFQRGPNQLGAYLVLPILVISALLVKDFKNGKNNKILILETILLISGLLVLYGTHSRSAWIATVLAGIMWIFLNLNKASKIKFIAACLVCALLSSGAIYQLRHTNFVQDVILHDKKGYGPATTSNSAHDIAIKQALSDIKQKPLLGCGNGCAGPASFYNPKGGKLAENYYLQIAQEAGILAGVLFIAIVSMVGVNLYRQKTQSSSILLASLVGLSVANLFLHIWADETVSIVWWSVAALVLYNNQKKFKNEKSKKTAQESASANR